MDLLLFECRSIGFADLLNLAAILRQILGLRSLLGRCLLFLFVMAMCLLARRGLQSLFRLGLLQIQEVCNLRVLLDLMCLPPTHQTLLFRLNKNSPEGIVVL